MLECDTENRGVAVVRLIRLLDIAGLQQVQRQRVDAVPQLVDLIDGGRSLVCDGIQLGNGLADITGQSLTHGSCQGVHRGAQQHRQCDQTPDQGLPSRALFSQIQIQLNGTRGITIDEYWVAVRFRIDRYGASGGDFQTFYIKDPCCGEQGLVGVELEFGDQSQPVPSGQLGAGPAGELSHGGVGVLGQRHVLNRLSRLRSYSNQGQRGQQATTRCRERQLLRQRLITQTL